MAKRSPGNYGADREANNEGEVAFPSLGILRGDIFASETKIVKWVDSYHISSWPYGWRSL